MSSRARNWQLAGGVLFVLLAASCHQNTQQSGPSPFGEAVGKADYFSDELLPPVPEDVFLIRNGDFVEGLDQWTVVPSSSNGTLGGDGPSIRSFEMDEDGEASNCVELRVGQKVADITEKEKEEFTENGPKTFLDHGAQQGAVLIQRIRVEKAGTYGVSAKIAAHYEGARPLDQNGYGGLFILRIRSESADGSQVAVVGDLEEVKDPAEVSEPEVAEEPEGEAAKELEPEVAGELEPENAEELEPENAEELEPENAEELEPENAEEPVAEVKSEEMILGEAKVIASHNFKIVKSGETKRHTLQSEVELEAGIYRIELFVTRQAKATTRTPAQYIDAIQIVPPAAPESDELLPEDVIPLEEEE